MVHILEVVSSRRNDLQMVSALARIVLNLPDYYSPSLLCEGVGGLLCTCRSVEDVCTH